MYYCNDCHQFMLPKLSEDMTHDVCLYCESEDIETASECKACGLPIRSREDYCEECLKTASRYIDDMANQMEVLRSTAEDMFLAVIEKE